MGLFSLDNICEQLNQLDQPVAYLGAPIAGPQREPGLAPAELMASSSGGLSELSAHQMCRISSGLALISP